MPPNSTLLLLGSFVSNVAAYPENLLAPECRLSDVMGLGGRAIVGLWKDEG